MGHSIQRRVSCMSALGIQEVTLRAYSAAKVGWTLIVLLQLVGLVLALLGEQRHLKMVDDLGFRRFGWALIGSLPEEVVPNASIAGG